LRGRKLDPGGAYVKSWVPELAKLPAKHIHAPWRASEKLLAGARVRLGETYPEPIVDLAAARARALGAYETIKGGSQ
ncbi:MAG TPA: deoxyribodipyrimidine photo-lyase, partial [Rhizobiales bacterium]|nr:deoxyribodipyrimidine photo-lyase [Hyphomicrobiales bacterium]